MTHDRPWPTELTRVTGRAIRRYREERAMTAERLAGAVSALGLRYTRTQVSNLESGRRDTVTLGEVLAFAAVLEVPPILLMFPFGSAEPVEVLPERSTDAWTAYRWLLGELPANELSKPPNFDVTWFPPPVVDAYRRHENGIRAHLQGQSEGLVMIAGARVQMQENDWSRPPLPVEIAEALRPVLLAFGWREDPPGELSRVAAEAFTTEGRVEAFHADGQTSNEGES